MRFAPSPTGAMHLGSALVALANASYARSTRGTLVLRIDDTDVGRSRDEDAFALVRLLRWLEIEWDEGPIHQRDRADEYRRAFEELLDRGDAYPCFCGERRLVELRDQQRAEGRPPRYDGRCRTLEPGRVEAALADGAPHVLRFAVPDARDVTIDDIVHGRVVVPAGSFGDPVLCRADGSVGYLLASVVDDIALGITHVIRGEDHLANTARQLLLFEALDPAAIPKFAHLPLLREVDGRKLSKRDPLGTLDELSDEGFLPVTVRRYLAELLGQGAIDLLASDAPAFRFERVTTGAPRVDRARLESLGREDMAALAIDDLLEGSGIESSDERAPLVAELAAGTHSRVALRGELRLVFDGPGAGDLPLVLRDAAPDDATLERADHSLELAVEQLRTELEGGADERWAALLLGRLRSEGAARDLAPRDLLRALRVALTGRTSGPGLELVLASIGAREALRRVHLARIIVEELRGGNDASGG